MFTLPPSKKRCASHQKPFHLIQKYYDENFILEDDEEVEFKKYILYNGDSRSNSKENSINSRSSLSNSNYRKSFKKSDDDFEEKKNNNMINININDDNNDNVNDKKNNLNNNKIERERNIFKLISEEFCRDSEDDESF